MNVKKTTILFSSIILLSCFGYSQDCIDYGEINEPPCVCTPPGWNGLNGAEEIDEAADYMGGGGCTSNVESESPTGGTFAAFHLLGGFGNEGMTTTITGLTPGLEYNLAFWWLSVTWECPGSGVLICCADLVVTVDGEVYTFEAANDWELAEMCIVASGTSMDIEVTGVQNGMQGHILVDDAECTDVTPCCPLQVEFVEEYEACPMEDVFIEGEYSEEVGDVEIEWTCEPPNGVNFLSETDVLEPIFNYTDENDTGGELEFEFLVTLMDEACTVTRQVVITVKPNNYPTFDIQDRYCENDGILQLPETSLEGLTGVWNINNIDFSEYANQDIDLVFTPDANPELCPLEIELEIQVDPNIVPSFDIPSPFCRSDESYELPNYSLEDVEGFWSIDEIFFEDFPDGELELEFFPDDELCNASVEITVEITSGEPVSFDLPQYFCGSDPEFILPTVTLEQIEGDWEEPTLIPSDYSGVDQLIFVPFDPGCYQDYIYTFEVTDNIIPEFNVPDVLCKTSDIYQPDNISNEGYEGVWQPSQFIPDTVQANSITLTWTSAEMNVSCLDSVNLVIELIQPQSLSTPELNDQLCSSEPAFSLMDINFNQSVTGQWDIQNIDPGQLVPGSYTAVFTPDSELCFENYTYNFEVLNPGEPEFSLPDTICINSLPFALPIVDNNGIEGQWNNSVIDNSMIINNEISINFVADTSCFNAYNHTIYVQAQITPEFDIPDYICWDTPLIDLPERSDNNVSGTWNISVLDPDLITGNSVDIIFTPDSEECSNVFSQSVSIVRNYELELDVVNPVSCSSADGSITILNPNSQLEYSLDGGTTWTPTSLFMNLQAGNYSLLARLNSAPECIEAYDFELTLPDIPSIIESIINHSLNCDDPSGSLELVLDQNNVEFSIDNGQTWTTQNIFDNLNPDNYKVLYRPIDRIDCEAEFNFEILAPSPTIIDEILLTPLSGCSKNDASILIEAQGLDLEYSIDGGQNWQTDNLFENLGEDQYDIIVRSSTQNNCEESASELILLPTELSIEEVTTNNTTSCNPQVGSITILPLNDHWQYSIDSGQSWQDENVFTELISGQYQVQIRDKEYQDCIDETTAEILEESEELTLPEFEIMTPTDCEAEDAAILLFSSIDNVEYNLEGESEWQTAGIFENLSSGMYEINIRLVDNPGCRNALTILIESVDCECPELSADYTFTDYYCTEEGGALEIINVIGYADEVNEIKWDNNTSGSLNTEPITGWNYFTIVYDCNCEYSDSIFAEFLDPLSFVLETFDPDCDESQNGSILITDVNGGQEPYNYSLNPEVFQDGPQFFNLSEGDYLAYVLDDNGCLKFQETSLENREALLNDIPQVEAINIGETTILNPLINANSIDSFSWSPSEYILNPNQLVAEVQPLTTTEFTLTIFHGECVEFRSVIVEVIESEILYISNIFNPNSIDNNRFFVQGNPDLGIQINEFLIYDRWGNLVFINENFEINQADQGWDGYYDNQKVNPGVFVYLINYSLPGSAKQIITGTITLVK